MSQFTRLAILVWCGFLFPAEADAAVIGYLDGPRAVGATQFETDFFLEVTPDSVGGEIELINLDIINSTINGAAVSDFTRVVFTPSTTFGPWQAGSQFGSAVGFESRVVLDGFAGVGAIPFPLADTNPIRVGQLRFDFAGLGLQSGDSITLDIVGTNDGSGVLTTAVAVREPGAFLTTLENPDFGTASGPGQVTFSITAVPEANGVLALALLFFTKRVGRRKKRRG